MKRRPLRLIAFGALAALVAVLADPLGIGMGGGTESIGWKQGTLLSLGVSVAVGGVGIMRGWFDGPQTENGWRGDPCPERAAVAPLTRSTGGHKPNGGRHRFNEPLTQTTTVAPIRERLPGPQTKG